MPYSSDSETEHSDQEVEVQDNTVLSESESVGSEQEKPKKKVVTALELSEQLSNLVDNLNEQTASFFEKEKAFEKDRKSFQTERKSLSREIDSVMKRLQKAVVTESVRNSKKGTRKKSSGFKAVPVPKVLKKYLEIQEDELTRPEVTKLLHAKFKAEGFKDGKTTTISSKKAAKALGCKHNEVIEFSQFMTFVSRFYNQEKSATN